MPKITTIYHLSVRLLFCSVLQPIGFHQNGAFPISARSVAIKDRSTTTNSRLLRVVIYLHYEASFCWCYSHC